MVPFSNSLVIGLSLVVGFFLIALIAVLYYLLWRKKRIINTEIEDKKRNSHESDPEQGLPNKEFQSQSFCSEEEGIESELMRAHNLMGPPRFLFTIKEELKEDLDSEDEKSRRGRSLSGSSMAVDTQFFTLFDESVEAEELNRLRSSPPPKFKFLRDAEEKLYRKLIEEARKKGFEIKASSNSTMATEEREVKSESNNLLPLFTSSSSQVLPLTFPLHLTGTNNGLDF